VDLSLSDGSISRAHCSVERDPETDRYMLIDLGSTNGTLVNGTRVRDRVPLSVGDKIFLGASVLRFSYADEVDLEYHTKLEEMVSIDPLTKMSTKRQYDAIYSAIVERARAEDSVLTVMVMDMDGLKQINDTHGHDMGGFAIAEVASIIRGLLGPRGHLCRFGGDEFVGCFPELGAEEALELAEEVRMSVVRHAFVKDGTRVEPTISIGVATFPRHVMDPKDLFVAADRAMYTAKRSGKNGVCAAKSDPSCPPA
jgi:diguanylate cyclase (GGDEF)-like protein